MARALTRSKRPASESPLPSISFDDLGCLNHSHQPRENPQHAAFGAAWHRAQRRRLRDRGSDSTAPRAWQRRWPGPQTGRSTHTRSAAGEYACIADQIAGGKVVSLRSQSSESATGGGANRNGPVARAVSSSTIALLLVRLHILRFLARLRGRCAHRFRLPELRICLYPLRRRIALPRVDLEQL